MGERSDSRASVHILADVAVLGHLRRSGVQADANAHPAAGEGGVGGGRCLRGTCGSGESDEEGIALRVHLDPCRRSEGATEQHAMLLEFRRVDLRPERVQEPGRALDVREQERHRSGGEVMPGHA